MLRIAPHQLEADRREVAMNLIDGNISPEHLRHARGSPRDLRAPGVARSYIDRASFNCSAGKGDDQLGHTLERAPRNLDVDTALEAIAGIGVHPERPTRGTNTTRIEVGNLHEQIRRSVADLAVPPAHDTGNPLRTAPVGDDDHFGGELALRSIKRHDALGGARQADPHLSAAQLREIERMRRL